MAGNLPGGVVAASSTAALLELALGTGRAFACLEGLIRNQLRFLARPGNQYNWAAELVSAIRLLSRAAGRFAALQEGKPEDCISEALTLAGQPSSFHPFTPTASRVTKTPRGRSMRIVKRAPPFWTGRWPSGPETSG